MCCDSRGREEEIFVGRDYQSRNNYSEKTQAEIDEEIKKILDYNYERATKILKENAEIMQGVLELQTMTAYDIMTPRVDVSAINYTDSVKHIQDKFIEKYAR